MRTLLAVVASLLLTAVAAPAAAPAPAQLLPFDGATGWINSKPLGPADLRDKVVLVDFWEYTCINCLRTLPYLREWAKRYAADGLVIVGVHTPEFPFSADPKNLADASKRLAVSWPVANDSNHTIWNRYRTGFYPHELLYDRSGNLIESIDGEGGYPQTETKIQAALKAGNPGLQLPPLMALLPQDSYSKPGAVCYPMTAETFLGGQQGHIANAHTGLANRPLLENFVDGGSHQDGGIYLQGFWRRTSMGMASGDGSGHLAITYHAIQVVGVMQPESGTPGNVVVTQDGKAVAHDDAGADVKYDDKGNSYVVVDAPRAYELIMNKKWGTHDLRLFPQHFGIGIYSFAFESCEAGSDK
ncbi:MAG: redoxin domain-containing protein [Candidatus Eremiobacteraeota bacterium]|nr:redoxin domain-containing protein [Candidatus Eremiobacteraeota bacterium]